MSRRRRKEAVSFCYFANGLVKLTTAGIAGMAGMAGLLFLLSFFLLLATGSGSGTGSGGNRTGSNGPVVVGR